MALGICRKVGNLVVGLAAILRCIFGSVMDTFTRHVYRHFLAVPFTLYLNIPTLQVYITITLSSPLVPQ